MQEQRLTLRLKTYWELIRKTNDQPDIMQFNSAVVEDLWPNCLKVSVAGQGKYHVFKYDYMGDPLVKLYGTDLSGQIVERASSDFAGMVINAKLEKVANEGVPMLDEGHFITRKGQMIKYRSCLLPFSNKKGNLTHIIVGISYRSF
ncbi:MAG: PAS domain-containing protein [Rickettsiales bacterium]|nr:PAS domain-containing protein [Rickettsiales bacterium]